MTSKEKTHGIVLDLFVTAATCIVMLTYSWVGYLGSDDLRYNSAATNWIKAFPFVGDTHWALRHTLVLPLSLSFLLFGVSEFSLILPSILYYMALAFFSYILIRMLVNRKVGLICSTLIATSPLFAVNGTICGPDVAEVFFIGTSVLVFYSGLHREPQNRYLVLAGILMGLGWYTRVTAVGLGLFYLLLFVRGWGVKRSKYLYIFAGLLALVAFESLYYWVLTGDPFHRIATVFQTHIHHGGGRGPETGNLIAEAIDWGILKPFMVLLFNQEFCILFWVTLPVIIFGLIYQSWENHEKELFYFFSLLFLTWFVFISYLAPVRLLPRYFNVAVFAACITIALFFMNLFNKRPVLSMFMLISIVLFNLLGGYVENKDFLFGERSLVDLTHKYQKTIYTDPATRTKASFLLQVAGKSVCVDVDTTDSLPSGSLYFYNPNRVLKKHRTKEFKEEYSPLESWELITTIFQERRWLGHILEKLKLKSYIPESIYKKLNSPNDPVFVYRAS